MARAPRPRRRVSRALASPALQYLSRCVLEHDRNALFAMPLDVLNEEERHCFEFVHSHVQTHRQFPDTSTLLENCIQLPEAPEPLGYYRDRAMSAANRSRAVGLIQELQEAIEDKDDDALRTMLSEQGRTPTSQGGFEPMQPFLPRDLPRLPWIYGGDFLQGTVTVTAAPGGSGKSAITLMEALCVATGTSYLGETVYQGPRNVGLLCLEDATLLRLRLAGAMARHGIGWDDLQERLHIMDRPTKLASNDGTSFRPDTAEQRRLIDDLQERQIEFLVVDPFVFTHDLDENNNSHMGSLMQMWSDIAQEANCAINIVHHTRKLNGQSASSEDARGGSAVINAARTGRVLAPLSKQEREQLLQADNTGNYVKIIRDKSNHAPTGAARYIEIIGQQIANGETVPVVRRFDPDLIQSHIANLARRAIEAVRRAADEDVPLWAAPQSTGADSIRGVVAEALGEEGENRQTVNSVVSHMEDEGMIERVDRHNSRQGRDRPGYDVPPQ